MVPDDGQETYGRAFPGILCPKPGVMAYPRTIPPSECATAVRFHPEVGPAGERLANWSVGKTRV